MIPSKSTEQDEEDKIRDALFILKAGEPLCYIINGLKNWGLLNGLYKA